MNKYIHLHIFTPNGKYFDDYISFLSVKSTEYLLGIYPNHEPLITTLDISMMIIRKDDKEDMYAISGGVMHIKENGTISLMLNSIERKDEIDINRALEAKSRAEKRLLEKDENTSIVRAEAALARALNRINIANK